MNSTFNQTTTKTNNMKILNKKKSTLRNVNNIFPAIDFKAKDYFDNEEKIVSDSFSILSKYNLKYIIHVISIQKNIRRFLKMLQIRRIRESIQKEQKEQKALLDLFENIILDKKKYIISNFVARKSIVFFNSRIIKKLIKIQTLFRVIKIRRQINKLKKLIKIQTFSRIVIAKLKLKKLASDKLINNKNKLFYINLIKQKGKYYLIRKFKNSKKQISKIIKLQCAIRMFLMKQKLIILGNKHKKNLKSTMINYLQTDKSNEFEILPLLNKINKTLYYTQMNNRLQQVKKKSYSKKIFEKIVKIQANIRRFLFLNSFEKLKKNNFFISAIKNKHNCFEFVNFHSFFFEKINNSNRLHKKKNITNNNKIFVFRKINIQRDCLKKILIIQSYARMISLKNRIFGLQNPLIKFGFIKKNLNKFIIPSLNNKNEVFLDKDSKDNSKIEGNYIIEFNEKIDLNKPTIKSIKLDFYQSRESEGKKSNYNNSLFKIINTKGRSSYNERTESNSYYEKSLISSFIFKKTIIQNYYMRKIIKIQSNVRRFLFCMKRNQLIINKMNDIDKIKRNKLLKIFLMEDKKKKKFLKYFFINWFKNAIGKKVNLIYNNSVFLYIKILSKFNLLRNSIS